MGVAVRDAVTEFLLAKRVEGLRPASIRSYREGVGRFLSWADEHHPGLRVEDLTVTVFRGYIGHLQETPTLNDVSVAKFVRELKVFSMWLDSEGFVEKSPFRGGKNSPLKIPKTREKLPKGISQKGFVALLGVCDLRTPMGRRDHAIVSFLFDTGVRVGELCNLTVEDVDIMAGRAKVHGKNRRERLVFFGAETQRSLLRYRSRLDSKLRPTKAADRSEHARLKVVGSPVDTSRFFLSFRFTPTAPSTVHQMLRRLAVRAKVTEPVNPHAFRHGFGVGFVERGGDIRSLQHILGHESVTTTEIYTHLSEEHLADMHSRFSPAARR